MWVSFLALLLGLFFMKSVDISCPSLGPVRIFNESDQYYIASLYVLLYPLIAYTLNRIAQMEDEFIKREEEAAVVEPAYAINDE